MDNYEYTIGKKVDLQKEQQRTLESPLLKSNFVLKVLMLTLDLFYGRGRTLPKFKVLEILARYPYWAWEDGAYRRLSRLHSSANNSPSSKTERYLGWIDLGRESQDNEQWHMLIIEEVLRDKGVKLNKFLYEHFVLFISFLYYHTTRAIFALSPRMAFYTNAAFEAHAEHQYMLMAQEHPEWDEEPIDSEYFDIYPRQETLGDLIRRIGLDERDHKIHSLEAISKLECKNGK